MPIRPEERDRYPKDWSQISLRIRERAGWKCEWCGVPNGELGGRTVSGAWLAAHATGTDGMRTTWPQKGEEAWCGPSEAPQRLRIVRIILTVAHLNHQPEDCRDENLKALCQRCHNRYDAPKRRAGILEHALAALGIPDLFGSSAP